MLNSNVDKYKNLKLCLSVISRSNDLFGDEYAGLENFDL